MDNKPLSYDILKELFNISVGKAADMLSEIVNRKIVLNVPNISILNTENKKFNLTEHLPIDGALMISSISFKDNLTGTANLIFPAEKMRTFINLCINESEAIESELLNFTAVDFDIVKEIGNIILNCIMGETGNYLDMHFEYTVPEVNIFDRSDFNNDIQNGEYALMLVLYITFIIDDTEIEGTIIVDLTLNSLNALLKKIELLEDGLYE